jgi:quaternary ammonium compound-resistance protein SugE
LRFLDLHFQLLMLAGKVELFQGDTSTGGKRMAWLILIIAGLFEVGWAVGLKYSDGLTRLWPSLATGAALILSMGLLAIAMKSLPLGTAYTVWTGIGAIGTVILGIVLFGEPASVIRLGCITLILAGIIGLKFASTTPELAVPADALKQDE